MSDDPRPPVREGYNRDPLPHERRVTEYEAEVESIYNWPLIVAMAIGGFIATTAWIIPSAILMWRWAL